MNDDIEPTSKRVKFNENIDENMNKNIKECSICMDHILDTDEHITKCNHTFHTTCINKWLECNYSCPYCRTVLKELQPHRYSNLTFNHYVSELQPHGYSSSNLTFNHPVSELLYFFRNFSNNNSNNSNNSNNNIDTNINTDLSNIPFALFPESHEPSGSANVSRIPPLEWFL